MFFIYVLKSKRDGSRYIGYTEDLRKRLSEHNRGKTKSIKHLIPFELVYCEVYRSKLDASRREFELKGNGQQREFLLDRIKNSLLV